MVGLESDVKPSDRWVMERFVTGGFEITGTANRRGGVEVFSGARLDVKKFDAGALVRTLTRCSLDIETDGEEITAIALITLRPGAPVCEEVVLVRRSSVVPTAPYVTVVRSEREPCEVFVARIAELDPDLLIGWNVLEFDLTVLERRAAHHRVPFGIGRLGKPGRILAGDKGQVSVALIPGRVVLDGIATLKNATWTFERFTLEYVARELLGRGKRIDADKTDRVHEIARMSREDPDALVHTYARLINGCIARRKPETHVAIHLCRGNAKSSWLSQGSYDRFAEALFPALNVDGWLLEYDDARSGGFEPLRFMPKDRAVVLGLITTKFGRMEDKGEVKRRIDQAAKFVPLDKLALSPQCGFASVMEGNLVTVADEAAKLRLVVEVAREVWGTV